MLTGGFEMNITVQTHSLRIELSGEELSRHGMTFGALEHNDGVTAGFLKRLYRSSKQLCGFAEGGEELVIEIFPAPDGGVVFYFTPEAAQRQEETAKPRLKKASAAHFCAGFLQLSSLLAALAAIGEDLREPVEAYEWEGRYYLRLPDTPALHRIISEFDGDLSPVSPVALREHGRLIFSDSLKSLRPFLQ